MQRYATQAKKGKVTASPEVIKLWGTDAGRTMAVTGPCIYIYIFILYIYIHTVYIYILGKGLDVKCQKV